MSMPALLHPTSLWFPPADAADADGLLAMGGDLSTERLLTAYGLGIFPWYADEVPLWWHPDPRFVLLPNNLRVSKTMARLLRQQPFQLAKNQSFEAVVRACQHAPRPGQDGTWINEEVVIAYTKLHHLGHARSFEAWDGQTLVGGLYGVQLGNVFFGESMFSQVSNASKAAFIWAVQQMKVEGIQLIDCQVYTPHLESLGAEMIARAEFLLLLNRHVEKIVTD